MLDRELSFCDLTHSSSLLYINFRYLNGELANCPMNKFLSVTKLVNTTQYLHNLWDNEQRNVYVRMFVATFLTCYHFFSWTHLTDHNVEVISDTGYMGGSKSLLIKSQVEKEYVIE